MNDRIFLDTNILIYVYSDTEKNKQNIARKLISDHKSYVSTQVLQELTNILTKKFNVSWIEVQNTLKESRQNNLLHINTLDTIIDACTIAKKYKFSFYDCLIIAAAIQCNCKMLYSEDMQHGQIIESQIKIVNPFL